MAQALIVFSHLRWDHVYQRPQHLLSRLARHRRVYFFEEPERTHGAAKLEQMHVADNVVVCRPCTPIANGGFHDDQIVALQGLLANLLADEGIDDYLVWFYTPMALPLMQQLEPRAVIYDCMDELAAFAHAPKQLLQRESALLRIADVVFTGGPSLYRAKQSRHPAVYCFPSSVEAGHFARAREREIEHPEQARVPGPKLGYFGVIDERMDLDLLERVALARPQWQFPLVGPVAKIDPARLPRQPNIHYFGQREYAQLPRFLAGWDACLLPFAINDATRFISPTKTLEYMAAGKPIVSTPITDVAEPYGDIVHLGHDVDSFVAACDRALAESRAESSLRNASMQRVLARTSWNRTAQDMERIIADILAPDRDEGGARALFERRATATEVRVEGPPSRSPLAGRTRDVPVVVIGAGPTGLSAAYHLGDESLLVEERSQVGGWCRSIVNRGFTFDYAGHIMFSNDPYVHELYARLLGDNVHWQDREAWIYSKRVYTRYPFQGALYGLPPDVLKECLVGAIEARFGSLKGSMPLPPGRASSSANDCKAESITDCCADGIAESTAALVTETARFREAREPRNFEEFIYRVWGAGVAKHFAIPYNRKLWAVPLDEMETSWLGGRVPQPDLEEMIEGALRPVAKPMGPNARFGYPLRGGFQALMNGFLPLLEGELLLNTRVERVVPSRHEVVFSDGTTCRYEQLVSTMPLPALLDAIGSEVPEPVRAAARLLRHVSVRCVNLGVGREHLTEKHWIYYPEQTVFHRVFVQGNASPHCNPAGGFGLTCEITYSPHKPLPCDGDALIDRCIADCIDVGLIRADDPILVRNQVDMPYAYVVYDHARRESVDRIRAWLARADIILAGRYAEWEYYNSDHAFLAGKRAAETALAALGERAPERSRVPGSSSVRAAARSSLRGA